MRLLGLCIFLLGQFFFAIMAFGQQADNSSTAYCDFDDGQEVSVRYIGSITNPKDEPHNGKVWLPGGSAMTLFTGVPLTFNNSTIPTGAYSVYVIPNKKDWTLIVNKNVNPGAAYDASQDVAKGPMDLGEVDTPPKTLQVSFAHTAPKTCSIRVYYGKVGAFTDFKENGGS